MSFVELSHKESMILSGHLIFIARYELFFSPRLQRKHFNLQDVCVSVSYGWNAKKREILSRSCSVKEINKRVFNLNY